MKQYLNNAKVCLFFIVNTLVLLEKKQGVAITTPSSFIYMNLKLFDDGIGARQFFAVVLGFDVSDT